MKRVTAALISPADAFARSRVAPLTLGQGAAVPRSVLVSGHRAPAASPLRIEGSIANFDGGDPIGVSSGANSRPNLSVDVSGRMPGVEAELERARAELSPSVEGRIERGFEGRTGDWR